VALSRVFLLDMLPKWAILPPSAFPAGSLKVNRYTEFFSDENVQAGWKDD
jgi:hypothetical protein